MDTYRRAFLGLDLEKKAKNNTFESFSKYICRKDVIKITSELLVYFKASLNSREFLSIYIFTYFPEINLSSNKTDLENKLLVKSNEIVTLIQSNTYDLIDDSYRYRHLFNNLCLEFAEIFSQWKILDSGHLKEELTKTYKRVKALSGDVQDQEHLDKTISNLQDIANKIGLSKLS